MAGESAERLTGRLGARTTGSVLDAMRADGWAVFHDVSLPGRRQPHLDHVVVGPPGVFVIDSKNWSGHIEVRENRFWHRGRRQDRLVTASSKAATEVAGLLGAPAAGTVRSAICFERNEPVVGWCYDVMLCSSGNLHNMLVRRPQLLSPSQVQLASIELDLGFHAPAVAVTERPDRTPKLQPRRQPRVRKHEPRILKWIRRSLLKVIVLVLLAIVLIDQVPRLAEVRDNLIDRVKDTVTPESVLPDLGFESCWALREVYPNGVGTPRAVRRANLKQWAPAAQAEVARASAVLDEDGDGLVCER